VLIFLSGCMGILNPASASIKEHAYYSENVTIQQVDSYTVDVLGTKEGLISNFGNHGVFSNASITPSITLIPFFRIVEM